MIFKDGMEESWKEGLRNNQDYYGRACFEVAELWADGLETIIKSGVNPENAIVANAQRLYSDIDSQYLTTGFQYGCIVNILSQVWKYGDILKDWHNKKYDYTGDGVVNPAILTLG